MPVKRDASHRRWVEIETVLPGSAEQVWQAVATGAGLSAWFVPATVEGRDGGALQFDFGEGAIGPGIVTAWEPPLRFAYEERDWDQGAPPLLTECLITPRGSDACVLRMTHALSAQDERWDGALEGFESGWPGFLAVLRLYLAQHAGEAAAQVRVHVLPDDEPAAWSRLVDALGLHGAQVGGQRAAPDGVPAFAGTVERIAQDRRSRELLLHLQQPCPGAGLVGSFAMGEHARCSVVLYLYGERAAAVAAAEQPRWEAWLRALLPTAETTP